ncbi:MAG: molybdenum cofactor guanylyltransferase [Planctomycetota bacterium]|nr:molybdenum cofactor guanylyltransferase [Planctomycetota bacterium]
MHSIPVAGLLLGGTSRRMGSPKHELQLPDGRLLLEHMLDLCDAVADRTLLCGDVVPGFDRNTVPDRIQGAGPLAGIEAVLREAGSGRCLVVPCDMPALEVEDLSRLVTTEGDIVLFEDPPGAPLQGLPMLIDANQLRNLEQFMDAGGRAIHRFIEDRAHIRVPIPMQERLLNINTPEDWAAYLESC